MTAGRMLTWAILIGSSVLLGACSGSSDDGNGNGNGKTDASVDAMTFDGTGITDGQGNTDATQPSLKKVGEACNTDEQCESAICSSSTCAKACTGPSDCEANQDCGSDDGTRLLCYARAYKPEMGASCAVKGSCTDSSLECFGGKASARAYCSGQCTADTDCPPQMDCQEATEDGKTYCVRRGFCDRCFYDEMCGPDQKCVQMGTEKFCSRACNVGKTECPGYAECKLVAKDEAYCIHKAGACATTGKLCDPCVTSDDCAAENGTCLHFITTKESFCASDCTSTTCPTGYECYDAYMTCVPTQAASCVATISPTMEVGDLMTDFAMVGYYDSNKDGTLVGEKLQVIKFSDFASTAKVILFNISTGWCPGCQEETQNFASLMTTYGPQGLMIVQVLFDDDDETDTTPVTVDFLDLWINALKPLGAVGLDPYLDTLPLNTEGSTPLNMLIAAKTRKVLIKKNGYLLSELQSDIQAALAAAP